MREKILKCDQCDKKFTRKDSLQVHIKKKHGFQKVYSCKYCDKHFQRNEELTTHIKTVHDKKTHVCEKCGKSFPSRSGKSNHKIFVNCKPDEPRQATQKPKRTRRRTKVKVGNTKEKLKRHKCDYCVKSFGQESSLIRHFENVHVDSPKLQYQKDFECGICGKWFITKANLMRHIKNIHTYFSNSEKSENRENNDNRELETINENEEKFDAKKLKNVKCDQCDKEFGLKQNLIRHIKMVHEIKVIPKSPKIHEKNETDYVGSDFDETNSDASESEVKNLMYKDSFVQVEASNGQIQSQEHEMSFHEISQDTTKDLLQSVSEPESNDDLGEIKSTRELRTMRLQKKIKAMEEESGNTKPKLKKHKCKFCEKTFGQKQILKCHIKTEHRIEAKVVPKSPKIHENKIYQCNHCEKTFKREFLLKKHIERVHELKNISEVKVETKTPKEKVKKYKCDFCEMSFNRETILSRHIKSEHKIQEKNESKIEAMETESQNENRDNREIETINENDEKLAAEAVVETETFEFLKNYCHTLYNERQMLVDMHNHQLQLVKAEKEKNEKLELKVKELEAEIAKLKSATITNN